MEQVENIFKTLLQNYELGFISSSELVFKYLDTLTIVGADTELREKMDDCLRPLADYLAGIIKGSGDKIKDFNR